MAGLLAPTGAAFANDSVVKTSFGNVQTTKTGKAVAGTKAEERTATTAVRVSADDRQGWILDGEGSENRGEGRSAFTAAGLRVTTESRTDGAVGRVWYEDQADWIGVREAMTTASMDYTTAPGVPAAALNLTLAYVQNGTFAWGGTIVLEDVERNAWVTRDIPLEGYQLTKVSDTRWEIEDLDAFLTALEAEQATKNFQIVAVGYSLGTGAIGDTTIRSISVADRSYNFGVDVTAGTVSISGTPQVGKKLTATPGTGWLPAGETDIPMAYEWKVGGTVVGTGPSYTVQRADQGKQLAVTAVGGLPMFASDAVTSAPVTPVGVDAAVVRSTADDLQGWNHDTESKGTAEHQYTGKGLRIQTLADGDKAAGFVAPAEELTLDMAADAAMDYDGLSGVEPSIQLMIWVTDSKGETTFGGTLVREKHHDFWWGTKDLGLPGLEPLGSKKFTVADLETLADKAEQAGLDIRVRYVGYALGTGGTGEAMIRSITAGGTTYEFGAQVTAGSVAISGTPRVGSTVSARLTGWGPTGETVPTAYEWKVGGKVVGTKATYKLAPADAGKRVTVTVSAGGGQFFPAKPVTSSAATVATAPFSSAPTPKIAGTAKVGSKLTASTGTWSPSAKLSYQWQANGSAIKGATKSTFTPGANERGKKITVQVRGTATGYTTATKTSAASKAVAAGTFSKANAPTISGTARVGVKLTAKPATPSPTAKTTYQWKVDGKNVSGATKSTFTPRAADRGKKVTVTTTATRAGYTTVTKTSAAKTVAAGQLGQTAKPKVVGQAKVGKTLRADIGKYKVKPTSVSYQWRVNGKAVQGLTKSTYTPTAKAVTGRVSVTVTVKKAGFTTITTTSTMTPKVTR